MKIREFAEGTNYSRKGQYVKGKYLGVPCEGIVDESRVTFQGKVKHYVVLAKEIMVGAVKRNEVILEESDVSEARWV